MTSSQHWENVYRTKASDQVSWFQPHAESSLRLIEQVCPDRSARIIDVGAGASVLVDDLLAAGYRHLSVLDIAAPALAIAQARLGGRAGQVEWRVGGVTPAALPE